MKIALTVKGVGLGAWLDEDFVHCGHVMIVEDDNRFMSWENTDLNNELASEKLIHAIIREKPDILITGEIAEPEKAMLSSADINVMDNRKGYVLELIEALRQ